MYSNFVLNLSIVDQLNNWPRNLSNNFALKIVYCLLKGKRIKSKIIYNGRGIAFGGSVSLSFGNEFARRVVISGTDNTLSSHTDK